ncbi:putative NBD/HSP70 family sugar kinase [Marinomonas balearica]|uniref:Putative NBD/HSP70 family sugar kinase n=2 Tax=Marinomonas balearica TaxID=491947 RepID=A0A4R6MEE6_9GAMM|nr:putative NBD/HSP70 family sugar kinase [Marinomonas balearica]
MNLIGSTSERSRFFNERIILQLIRQYPDISRQEISAYTKLSAQTISVISSALIERNLIVSEGKVKGKRGQPQKKLNLNDSGAYGVGVNVDRDFISVALVNFGGKCIYQIEERISFPGENNAKAIVAKLVEKAADFLGNDWFKVQGIGLSRPDYMGEWTERLGINSKSDVVEGLDYWNGSQFEDWLEGEFSLPVMRENDAQAAALCELFFSTQPLEHIFYLYMSTAVGGCIIENGECLNGTHGAAGQFGLLYTKTGKFGERVLEALSLTSLQRFLMSTYNRTLDDLDENSDSGLIYEWAKSVAVEVLPAFVALLALTNPSEVRVGGRMPAWMIVPFIMALSEALSDEPLLTVPSIQPARYARYSGALGAAVLPLYERFAPQTSILKLKM